MTIIKIYGETVDLKCPNCGSDLEIIEEFNFIGCTGCQIHLSGGVGEERISAQYLALLLLEVHKYRELVNKRREQLQAHLLSGNIQALFDEACRQIDGRK